MNDPPFPSVKKPDPDAPARKRITVVYVLSSPHSGSTVLGMVLGAHPTVFCGGELNGIPVPAWTHLTQCACSASGDECPFWSTVRTSFAERGSLEQFRRDQALLEGWRSLPRALWETVRPSAAGRRHAAALATMAREIATASGRSTIIDTSKLAPRGLIYNLARSREFEVRYLHVVRDGRGVVASRKSRTRRVGGPGADGSGAAARFALLWTFANAAYTAVFSRFHGRYLRLRYEDLLSDPSATLERLGRFLELDLSGVIARVREGATFSSGHVVEGNRLRLTGGVRLRPPDSGWKSALTPAEQRTFWRWAGWLARRYGYRDLPPAANQP